MQPAAPRDKHTATKKSAVRYIYKTSTRRVFYTIDKERDTTAEGALEARFQEVAAEAAAQEVRGQIAEQPPWQPREQRAAAATRNRAARKTKAAVPPGSM